MTARVLVAGAGNVFLGDDGFGVEVIRRLGDGRLPAGVRVEDVGIRGVHLAYELLTGYDTLVLVDAAPRGERPGTVSVIEVDLAGVPDADPGLLDAHDLAPDTVLAMLRSLGGRLGAAYVVGCEPACTDPGMGLSEPVAAAVDGAVVAVRELVGDLAEQRTVDESVGG